MRGLFGSVAAAIQHKTADASALTWSALLGLDGRVKSGVSVTVDSALRVSTVLAAARVLAEGVAQVPLKLYRETEEGSAPARDHAIYRLLYRRPNDWQTSFEFREGMMFHAVLCRAAYAYIGRIDGEVRELIPLAPGCVTPVMSDDYELHYEIRDRNGLVTRQPRANILTVRGPSWDNYSGLQMVDQAREAIGLAIATEETHARLHSNGGQPGGLLTTDNTLSLEARNRLREQFTEHQAGLANKFKTMVLDNGLKWQQMQMTGLDAQHVELRKLQIEEICRCLRVFPQMIGFSDKTATFASAEAFFLAHVIHSLQPWIERWEQCIARDLLSGKGDLELFAKFSLQGLLRGDSKSRSEFYTSGINNGWLTRNEVRRFEDMNALDGLDDPLVPLNMGTQAERDAVAEEFVKLIQTTIVGELDNVAIGSLRTKVGRVLSAANERRIVSARDNLSEVLSTLPPAKE